MILIEETYQQFGYNPDTLSEGSNKSILVKCDSCGKNRKTTKNAYRELCLDCANKNNAKKISIALKGQHNSPETEFKKGHIRECPNKVSIICQYCGDIFDIVPSAIEWSTKRGAETKFCSRSCADKDKSYRKTKNKICSVCGLSFKVRGSVLQKGDGLYCSKKCYASAKKGTYSGHGQRKMQKKCVVCGKEFEVKACEVKKGGGKTCSKKCYGKYSSMFIRGEKHPNWHGGVSFEPYCTKFNKQLKEHIRERDNRTCQLCGIKENGRKLDVHHIHYDKPNCNPDLIALCQNCNKKANFNRDVWEKYFIELLKSRDIS